MTRHGFCSLHRIGYDRSLDPACPQCVLAGHLPPKQYDFDSELQSPVDAAGKPVKPEAVVMS
jgi:hypothetical protein